MFKKKSTQTPPSAQQVIVVQQPRQSNMLAAIISFFLPGVGQLIQGRFFACITWWVLLAISAASCVIGVGFVTTPILWLIQVSDAAAHK
jgi:hypothetical protein